MTQPPLGRMPQRSWRPNSEQEKDLQAFFTKEDMSLSPVSCPGEPGLVCYSVGDYCVPGPMLGPYDKVPRGNSLPIPIDMHEKQRLNSSLKNSSLKEVMAVNGTCPNTTVGSTAEAKEALGPMALIGLMQQVKTCPGYAGLLCSMTGQREQLKDDWVWFCAAISGLLFILIALEIGRQIHIRKQAARVLETDQAKEVEKYETYLVKNLVPRISLPNYQFKGLRRIPEDKHVSLKFEDLSLTLHSNQKCVLAGVTGEINSCTMNALMGPSGAGKTTFLNVLCGKAYYGDVDGAVLINGEQGEVSSLKPVMGFVPQDDTVFETLTVREQIAFSAKLRNPAGTPHSRIINIVEDVLAVMQIRHIQNSIVGGVESRGISGGQRKRVNIALELAACPILLFLDEPTTGLDATSSLEILSSLKCMAKLGMTIIMVIHQPRYSLFELFDNVVLLGVGGHTVYQGPSEGAQPYFESLGYEKPANDNPADWFMDVLSGHVDNKRTPSMTPDHLFDLWVQNKDASGNKKAKRSTGTENESEDTSRMISQALESEWHNIDENEDGVLSRAEFSSLLVRAAGGLPSDSVFEVLWKKLAFDGDTVAQSNFVQFFKERARDMDVEESEATETEDEDEFEYEILIGKGSVDDRNHMRKLGCCAQFWVVFRRAMIIYWRKTPMRFMNYGLVAFAAVVIGLMTRAMEPFNPLTALCIFIAHITLSLLIAISALDVFGGDRPMIWREASSGINRFAMYLARILVHTLSDFVSTLVFVVLWYWSVEAKGDVEFQYFVPLMLLALTSAAIGYAISTMVPPQNATLTVCIVVMILGACLAQPGQIAGAAGSGNLWIYRMSYLSFSVGMTYVDMVNVNGGPDLLPVGPGRAIYSGYVDLLSFSGDGDAYWTGALAMACTWMIFLIIGYFGLVCLNTGKQI